MPRTCNTVHWMNRCWDDTSSNYPLTPIVSNFGISIRIKIPRSRLKINRSSRNIKTNKKKSKPDRRVAHCRDIAQMYTPESSKPIVEPEVLVTTLYLVSTASNNMAAWSSLKWTELRRLRLIESFASRVNTALIIREAIPPGTWREKPIIFRDMEILPKPLSW